MYYLFRTTIRLLNRQLLFIEHIDNLINVCNSVLLTNVLDLTMCYLRPRAISSYEPFCCFIDYLQNMYHVIKRRKQVSVVHTSNLAILSSGCSRLILYKREGQTDCTTHFVHKDSNTKPFISDIHQTKSTTQFNNLQLLEFTIFIFSLSAIHGDKKTLKYMLIL